MRGLPPTPETLDLVAVLNCLADRTRLSIVRDLAENDDLECGTFDVPVTKSTLTHHFRVLRESGVISTTRVGTRSLNRLRRAELDDAFPGLLDAVLGGARTAAPRTARLVTGTSTRASARSTRASARSGTR